MSFQTPIRISDALHRIGKRSLLLPAIQREFVWEAWQIEWLFDSILQGYPIGSFLFWEVRDPDAKRDYRYYEFLRVFRERYATHNPHIPTVGHGDFDAVLDGQQRLTALYIGLAGSYAYKRPRIWWDDTEEALPTRQLYLNVQTRAPEDTDKETGRLYELRFLTGAERDTAPENWFRVGEIVDVVDHYAFTQLLKRRNYQDSEFATRALSELHSAVHLKPLINYYLVQRATLEEALNIFVRVNGGGSKLSLSDMLLSTAIANWSVKDARKEILGLVDHVRARGFFIDKDLVLKTCLYLYSSDIRYKASNFTAAQVKPFEDNWDSIARSILSVFDLVRLFGFNDTSLTSHNALLPVIYWVHHRGLAGDLTTRKALGPDRHRIRKWLHTVLLKGIFGASADTTLAAIRKSFAGEDLQKRPLRSEVIDFPIEAIGAILQTQGKDPTISDEFIDALLDTRYEEKHAFSILALLAPNLDYQNGDFHKDHLHPATAFRTQRELRNRGVSEADLSFYRDEHNWNSILNLRHLDSTENKSKQDRPLRQWCESEAEKQEVSLGKFCLDHDLPSAPATLEFLNFREFIGGRRTRLRERLRDALTS
jgi:hypothetical protein